MDSAKADELPFLIDELRDVIQQAHIATSDLSRLLKEAQKFRDEISLLIKKAAEKEIAASVKAGLKEYDESIHRAIDEATEKVNDRFDAIAATLMGEDPRSRRAGLPSIPEMIHDIAVRSGATVSGAVPRAFLPPGTTSFGSSFLDEVQNGRVSHHRRDPRRKPGKQGKSRGSRDS